MKFLYLLPLIFALASANLAVDISIYDFPPVSLYPCLKSQNTTLAILEIFSEKGNINKNFLATYISIRNVKISNVDAIIRVNDAFTPEEVANQVARALPTKFNGTVWLEVVNQQSRWSLNETDRIPYLSNLTKACKEHGLKPGVYSSADDWNIVMGNQGKSSDILNAVPVWYLNSNGVESFDDFDYAGFGAWEKPQMKSFKNSAFICDMYVGSLNYYEDSSF